MSRRESKVSAEEMDVADTRLKAMFEAAKGSDDGLTAAAFQSWCSACGFVDRWPMTRCLYMVSKTSHVSNFVVLAALIPPQPVYVIGLHHDIPGGQGGQEGQPQLSSVPGGSA
jgi:hypothetical protein